METLPPPTQTELLILFALVAGLYVLALILAYSIDSEITEIKRKLNGRRPE